MFTELSMETNRFNSGDWNQTACVKRCEMTIMLYTVMKTSSAKPATRPSAEVSCQVLANMNIVRNCTRLNASITPPHRLFFHFFIAWLRFSLTAKYTEQSPNGAGYKARGKRKARRP